MSYYKYYKGKKLGPYNYTRSTHKWTAKDLARIARKLNDDGVDAGEILILVASAVGFVGLFCKIAKLLTAALSINTFIKQIGTILALSTFITTLIQFLIKAQLIAPTWLKIVLALLIALFVFIDKFIQALNETLSNLDTIDDVSQTVFELCDKAKELAGQAVTATCEATSADACYWAGRKAEDVANALKSDTQQFIDEMSMPLIERFWRIVQDDMHSDDWRNWWN